MIKIDNKLKEKIKNIANRAFTCGGIFAITQELFQGQVGGISIFTMIMFVGLFVLSCFRQKI
jgi:hypothetical protein